MCIFAVASTISPLKILFKICCELLQNVYLCSSKHNRCGGLKKTPYSCELLQNVYLCSSKHNIERKRMQNPSVVNCFKMCIFAVASTISPLKILFKICCELLQNVYLCSSKHNGRNRKRHILAVVNCFKMCIFAVASTIAVGVLKRPPTL